jgi:hypothetical protein
MTRVNLSQLCCLIVLVSSLQPSIVAAQGMPGMGGMGGGMGMNNGGMSNGRMGNSGAMADPQAEPEKPVVKYNPFTPDATPVQGLESRTAALERFVFGHSETNPKMKVRVQRLEKRLVPYEKHSASEMNLEKRVDHLWATLEAGNKNSPTTKAPPKEPDDKDAAEKDAPKGKRARG